MACVSLRRAFNSSPLPWRFPSATWYWHMATFFYEFCWDMFVFVLLMVTR